MATRPLAALITALFLTLTTVSPPVSAVEDHHSLSVTEESWAIINDPKASFEDRCEAERALISARDAKYVGKFIWQMLDDISTPIDGDSARTVSFFDAYTRHIPISPGPEATDVLPLEVQIAQSRARVAFAYLEDSVPVEIRRSEFEKLLSRALKLDVGQTLKSGTVITEELRTWLLQGLIADGAAINWSPSISDQLLSVVTDESLPEEVRVSAVSPIIGRARFDPLDAASRGGVDALIQFAWDHRGQEFTRRITPPLTLIRDPQTALLLLDWAESVDPATATVQDAEFVVGRFDWYFDDVSGQYIPHGGEHPRDRELRQERMELQRQAVESGDWSAVREFNKRVLAERRREAQERHATIMDWIDSNRRRLEAKVAGGVPGDSV